MGLLDSIEAATLKAQRRKDWTGKRVLRLTMTFDVLADDPTGTSIVVRDDVTDQDQVLDREMFLSRRLDAL